MPGKQDPPKSSAAPRKRTPAKRKAVPAKNLPGPDQRLMSVFQTLFRPKTAQHAYDRFAKSDQFDGAYSTDLETNLWRSWRAAKMQFESGRPIAALDELKATEHRFALDPASDRLAEAERLDLLAACLNAGNQLVPAAQYSRLARQVFRRFLQKIVDDRDSATAEVHKMLELLISQKLGSGADDTILPSWLVSRGVDFACYLAQRIAFLPHFKGEQDDLAASGLRHDISLIESVLGYSLPARARGDVHFTLGDIFTESDPRQAFQYFDSVAESLGVEDGTGLEAAINAANCLMRTGELAEAEARYASLESLFEMMGDYSGAARVWMSECVANWKRLHDPKVLHSLVGAIKMYEEAIPAGADAMTRYVQKQYIEPGYMLLIAAIAYSSDRSDTAINQLLSAVWCMLSRDLLANLEPKPEEDPWRKILSNARRPLAEMKSALAPYPGLAIVHLIPATDSMVWIACGFDQTNQFRFECAAAGPDHAERLAKFIATMQEELEADRTDDALACADIESEMATIGDALAADLPSSFCDLLTSMKRLIYMPHPYGNVDEFPLGGLRIRGQFLSEQLPIVRSPSVTHLRESLSPNRADVLPQGDAFIVLGAAEAMGQALQATSGEAERAKSALQSLGFNSTLEPSPTCPQMEQWLDGAAGALHYIGHGLADNINEGLPLSDGEVFGPLNADHLDGFRVPFVFLCACMAARVRSGRGGYQTGIASKLIERGAPGVISFLMPITEKAAYSLSRAFYRAAAGAPFGDATLETMRSTKDKVPLYARLAFTAYGDPSFVLTTMPRGPKVRMLQQESQTWDSSLRTHCVLRTEQSAAALSSLLSQTPAPFADLIVKFLATAFRDPSASHDSTLDQMDDAALHAETCTDAQRLSIHAAVLAERLHRSGLEAIPIYIDTSPESVRQLLADALFLAEMGAGILDARLNGLGHSFRGRVITVDQNDATYAALSLRQGREKLLECEPQSAFVQSLREGDGRILAAFGLPA